MFQENIDDKDKKLGENEEYWQSIQNVKTVDVKTIDDNSQNFYIKVFVVSLVIAIIVFMFIQGLIVGNNPQINCDTFKNEHYADIKSNIWSVTSKLGQVEAPANLLYDEKYQMQFSTLILGNTALTLMDPNDKNNQGALLW